jgi:hypothetical protein
MPKLTAFARLRISRRDLFDRHAEHARGGLGMEVLAASEAAISPSSPERCARRRSSICE